MLTNRATHLCKCNPVADILNYAPSNMCYHAVFIAEFGHSALKGVASIQENPRNWGALDLRSIEMESVADPKIHAPPSRVTMSCDKGCTDK